MLMPSSFGPRPKLGMICGEAVSAKLMPLFLQLCFWLGMVRGNGFWAKLMPYFFPVSDVGKCPILIHEQP